jgi:hypothetical protein
VHGGEHHAARGQLAQVGAAFGLHRGLAQQLRTAREGAEELAVEVVAVCEDNEGRVIPSRFADDASGVEREVQVYSRAPFIATSSSD